MASVRRWTGHEARALRVALRFTVRAFAEHLGVAVRTVSKWEKAGAATYPLPDTQAMLDTVLCRADGAAQQRFELLCQPQRDDGDAAVGVIIEDTDDVNRRELLRLLSMTGASLALPPIDGLVDAERMVAVGEQTHQLDRATLDDYARLNAHMWQVYSLAPSKKTVLPLVREQLAVLSVALGNSDTRSRNVTCCLVADLYQLAGEVLLDACQFTDSAHCYLLAATSAREARAYDLWATALTRQAFIAVYERQLGKAVPMLNMAERVARRGASNLSTRHWVAAVRAETLASLGDEYGSQRDLDAAHRVLDLGDRPHRGGWLRFDGARLPEQRGTCMVALGRLEQAELALNEALTSAATVRRKAIIQIDLGLVSARRRDPEAVAEHLGAAIAAARATASGVISGKLRTVQGELSTMFGDARIRELSAEIKELSGPRETI
jgi:transcriptional regulator with XRE-family HTH domain